MEKYIENTINYYDKNSNTYYETWGHNFLDDFDWDIPDIFLSYLKPDSYILDLGCGIGRDSKYFKEKNYKVKAIDGSKKMCEIASKILNEPVEQINFLDINYINEFDGIFACASLLHLNNEDLIECLKKLVLALKDNGIIYASFKFGENERMKENRYFNDMTEEKFEKLCENIPQIEILKSWKSPQYDNHISFINFIVRKNI